MAAALPRCFPDDVVRGKADVRWPAMPNIQVEQGL